MSLLHAYAEVDNSERQAVDREPATQRLLKYARAADVISSDVTHVTSKAISRSNLIRTRGTKYEYWRNHVVERQVGKDRFMPVVDVTYVANSFLASRNSNARFSEVEAFLAENGGFVSRRLLDPDYFVVETSLDNFSALIDAAAANKSLFEAVSLIELLTTTATPNDTHFNAHQWQFRQQENDSDIDAVAGWDTRTSTGTVRIAVIDTGVQWNHPDLQGNIVGRWDFVEDDDDPSPSSSENWHGTWTTGIVGAVGNNSLGVAGAAWTTRMLVARVATSDEIIEAIEWAFDNNAAVVSLSIYINTYNSDLYNKINERNGMLYVAAAGNTGINLDTYNEHVCFNDSCGTWTINGHPGVSSYPARFDFPHIISVSGSNENNQEWVDSSSDQTNKGTMHVDIAAPARVITSTFPNSQYGFASGTSASAPQVAAVTGLVMAQFPNRSLDYYKNRVVHTGKPRSGLTAISPEGKLLSMANALTLPDRWWMSGTDIGNNTLWNSAYYYLLPPGDWVYHYGIGWLFSTSESSNVVWFWDYASGKWVSTAFNGYYPYFVVYPSGGSSFIVYFDSTRQSNPFYWYSTNSWHATF